MSSRRSKTGGGVKYPTPWSAWEWNAAWKCEYRYRYIDASGTDEAVEYAYREAPQSSSVPRDQSVNLPAGNALSTIQESSTSQTSHGSNNYTHQPADDTAQVDIDNLTQQTARVGLDEGDRSSSTPGRPASSRRPSSHYSQQTPLPGVPARRIWTKDPSSEADLDPAFKIHQSWEFKFGRVFKVLWTEPAGSTGTIITNVHVKQAKYGEPYYSSIRRFVIVSAREGHSICLPILTYGGQGTLKKGVHVNDHAVIYTGKAPVLNRKEKITKKAIRMDPIDPRHKLDAASRVNYAKLYTVEHNVKVNFIGQIARKYEQQVVTDYNATHRPLPDRPYYDGNENENAFEHTQGSEPAYTAPGTLASWPTATTMSPNFYDPSMYNPTSSYQVPYASQTQSYHTPTSQYDTYSGYDPNKVYPGSVQTTEPDGVYRPFESNHPEELTATGPTSDPGDTPDTPPQTDDTEDPPATDDSSPHYEEDLYEADDK